MKQFYLYITLIFLTLASCKDGANASGTPNSTANSCIDSSKINAEAICTMQYDPVCGCDNKTYGNECEAVNKGVTRFTKGECN